MAGFCIVFLEIIAREEDRFILKDEEKFLDGYALKQIWRVVCCCCFCSQLVLIFEKFVGSGHLYVFPF